MTVVRIGEAILVAVLSATLGCRCHRVAQSPECDPEQVRANDVVANAEELSEAEVPSKLTVTMRIVDGQGPLAGRRCAMEVESSHRVSALMRGTTDEGGRVSMPWRSAPGTGYVQVWRGSEGQPSLEGIVTADYDGVPPAVLDLGEVRVNEAPLLASGIVCNAGGTRIAGAAVSIEGWDEVMCGGGLPGPGPFWGRFGVVNRFRAVSDSKGQFMLLGSSGFAHLMVRAEKAGYVQLEPDEMFLRKGDRNLRVVVASRTSKPKNAFPDLPPPPPPPAR